MQIRLHKIDQTKGQKRFYVLTASPTLFGEWSVTREFGRIGNHGGQTRQTWHECEGEALEVLHALRSHKERRGYIITPEQLTLPLWQ